MNRLTERIKLIKEGDSFKDRFFILIFSGLSLVFRPFTKEGTRFLFKDVIINTKEGKFLCRKKKDDVSIFMGYDDKIGQNINLEEGTFVDIGSHIGKYTSKIGRKKGTQVISIELMSDNFKVLKRNSALNNLNNVILLNVGCSDKDGKVEVFSPKNGNSTVGNSLISNSSSRRIGLLEVKKLDSIVRELNIKRVDLIKIDVEGAEYEVFNGALETLKKFHPKIVFEISNKKNFLSIISLLNPLGYKIKKIDSSNALAEYVKE